MRMIVCPVCGDKRCVHASNHDAPCAQTDIYAHNAWVERAALEAAASPTPAELIYCEEKKKPGGCQLHNLHCGWPECNKPPQARAERAAVPALPKSVCVKPDRFEIQMRDGTRVTLWRPQDEVYATGAEAIDAVLAAVPASVVPAEPSGYAYRYPDGIRFNDGCEVNGSKPTEALPYYFGTALAAGQPSPKEKT